mmetsp:Transcript_14055/g.14675  ORF Transcript_14055/g.14675 Transcript_14055/m.14675 type:complete len:244 (-) Transcript_14055:411-1142(-)
MRKWVIIDESLKKTKLKPEEKLYCEGSLKPFWRGKMHLLAFIFFPFAITSLLEVSETRTEVLIGSFIFSMSNMISYGISFMFHCFDWSPRIEILLQKLDHVAIFVNTAVAITQYCVFVVRTNRALLLYSTWILCCWGAYLVFALKKQTFHHAMTSLPLFWIIPELSQLMSQYQFSLFLMTWSQVFIGMLAYGFKWPTPWPNYFGYHEIMHLLTTTAAISAILLQHNMLQSFDANFCLFADTNT